MNIPRIALLASIAIPVALGSGTAIYFSAFWTPEIQLAVTGDASSRQPPASQADDGLAPLALRLKSVLLSPFAASAVAVIDDGSQSRPFAQGTEISPGVQLAEVHHDHVVIVRGMRRDTLLLESPGSAESGRNGMSGWGELISHGGGVVVGTPAASGLGHYLDLHKGDKILRVNGAQISSSAELHALAKQLSADASIYVEGVRDGKPMALLYDYKDSLPD